jgi:hypothetical protein
LGQCHGVGHFVFGGIFWNLANFFSKYEKKHEFSQSFFPIFKIEILKNSHI